MKNNRTSISFTAAVKPTPNQPMARRFTRVIRAFLIAVCAVGSVSFSSPSRGQDSAGQIAFFGTLADKEGIYLMNPDGTNVHRVPNTTFNDFEPNLSPDGTRIVFSSYRAGSDTDIFIINTDGTGLTPLTKESGSNSRPSFSPDGTQVAFISDRNGDGDLFIVDADGTNETPIPAPAGHVAEVDWSPDGSRLALVLGQDTASEIWVMDPDGSNQVQVTNNSFTDDNPSFSPDGTQIAFRTVRTLGFTAEVYLMNADGTNQVRIADGRDPSFSPDGTQIAFVGSDDNIHKVDVDGSNDTPLNSGGLSAEPDWGSAAPATAPTVQTKAADHLTATGATLHAIVNPQGTATIVFFEYGLTNSYGQATTGQNVGSGTADVAISKNIAGLKADTVYHFHAVATNAGGTTAGADMTFTTTSAPAPFTVHLTGQKNDILVRPNTGVEIEAVIEPAGARGASIAQVQFFVNDDVYAPDTKAPYELSTIVRTPGHQVIYAVATDTEGRKATSPPVQFTVADASAGFLALQTIVEPSVTVQPGGFITYRMIVTNTSDKATAKNVTVTAPVPRNVIFQHADIVDAKNKVLKIKSPDEGKNPRYLSINHKVEFYLGDFAHNQVKVARLKVRVPFDAHEGDDPIHTRDFKLTGAFGGADLKGTFADKVLTITGVAPANAPHIALAKGVIDDPRDREDDTDFVSSGDTAIALTTNGEKVSFVLVGTNYGGLPATRVSVKDQIPRGFTLVEGSVRINDKAAGPAFELKDRTMTFTFGDFAPHQSVGISYQLRVNAPNQGGPAVGKSVESKGAEMRCTNLRHAVDSAPERLEMMILPPAAMILEAPEADPAASVVDVPQSYKIRYRNDGKRPAKNVKIRQELPLGTKFKNAFLTRAPKKNISAKEDGPVIFDIGDVDPGEHGEAVLTVDVTSAVKSLPKPGVFLPAATFVGQSPSGGSFAGLDAAQTNFLEAPKGTVEYNRLHSDELPNYGILKKAPKSVRKGDTFSIIVTVFNTSKFANNNEVYYMPIPAGAEYVSHSESTESDHGGYNDLTNEFRFEPFLLSRGDSEGFTIVLRATGDAYTEIVDENSVFGKGGDPDIVSPRSVTLIIEGDASAPDNQTSIELAQLPPGTDASVALSDPDFLQRVRKIDANSPSLSVAAADHIQLNNGGIIIPLGAGNMVAAGAGNMVAAGAGNLIGNDGSTFVYAGNAAQIQFHNLIGNDGSTLIGNDGSTLLSNMINGAAGNLVAAGAGNLVAAGGLNLIGLDGNSLIGNDGSTFGRIASLVAAGGGNLVAAGGGNLANRAPASLISNGALSLVAAGGGNLVAAGGGNIGPAISCDASRAMMMGRDGSTMVAAGAGNVLANFGRASRDSAQRVSKGSSRRTAVTTDRTEETTGD